MNRSTTRRANPRPSSTIRNTRTTRPPGTTRTTRTTRTTGTTGSPRSTTLEAQAGRRAPRAVRGIVVVAALALTAACSGGGAEDPVPTTPAASGGEAVLRIGPLETQNVLRLCLDAGTLEEHLERAGARVEVTAPFPAFAPAAEAMSAGHIDMTSSGATGVVTALEGTAEPVIFAVERNDGDSQGIVATGASGIAEPEDLAGRRIAVNQGGTGDYLARLALDRVGLTAEDVELVHLGPADAATAFAAGQVDAWATWDQFLVSAQLQPGARTVALSRDIDAVNPSVHVVSQPFLEAHPEAVRATFEALEECADALEQAPDTLAAAYLDAGAPAEVADTIGRMNPPGIVAADASFGQDLAGLARFYADEGLSEGVVDVTGAVVDVADLG